MSQRYSFGELRDTGLLWLINKAVLHPRGFALALHYDEPVTNDSNARPEPVGWSLEYAGHGECFTYAESVDETELFQRVETLLTVAATDEP